jgi:hypothetical protein
MMVSLFQDCSFSNGAHAMLPIDFRYRLSDQGRIVLGPLSSEETVEFELLSQRDREGLMDLPSELRLLELYVKYVGCSAEAPLAPSGSARDIEPPRPRRPRPPRTPRASNYIVSMIVIASVSFTLIALLVS